MINRLLVASLALFVSCASAAEAVKKPAAIPVKAEVQGLITEDEFTKIAELLKAGATAGKIGDGPGCMAATMKVNGITNKVAADPESWSAADFTARATSWRRYMAVTEQHQQGSRQSTNLCLFYNSTCDYVADAQDAQDFIKRWQLQAGLTSDVMPKMMYSLNWETLRRKEMLEFMNAHMKAYPDAKSRVQLLTQLAAVGVRSKALKELQAEMSDTPAPPDDPKDNPKNKRRLRQN